MSYKYFDSQNYNLGLLKEVEILPIITKYFNRTIQHNKNRFCKYDFKDDNYYYELKNRNNKKDDYPTTMIAEDKIIHDNIILLFNFIDGLYYINYEENKELFKTFEIKLFKRYRPNIKDIEKNYLYIPVKHLIKIE